VKDLNVAPRKKQTRRFVGTPFASNVRFVTTQKSRSKRATRTTPRSSRPQQYDGPQGSGTFWREGDVIGRNHQGRGSDMIDVSCGLILNNQYGVLMTLRPA
jgi:hypothetical protein